MPRYGGIEAGGTKFVCAVGSGPDDLVVGQPFPTTSPQQTLERAVEFFKPLMPLEAIGLSAFGPLDLHPASPTYGYITTTPKSGWEDTPIVSFIRNALNVPVYFDTDVNGAALGEHRWGTAQGLDTFVYLTIGTGIGGGGMAGGKLMHGLIHPEMGHILLPHDLQADPYPGHCPSHGDCLEGLAAGPAIEERWKAPARALPPDHPAWDLEARYLAMALANFTMTISPQRIIMGGGVMRQEHLFPLIRQEFQKYLNRYLTHPAILEHIDQFIVPPLLGDRAGVLGAIVLAEQGANDRD